MKRGSKRKYWIIFSVVLAVIVIISYINSQDLMEDTGVYPEAGDGITVSFIDVGKSDSILISADGYNLLIDAGLSKSAEEVSAYLDRYSVETLDLVIATHPDADHIGGMSTIVENYEVSKYITYDIADKYDSTSKTYNTLLQTLEDNDVDITYTTAGDTYTFGSIVVDVLSPDHEYKDTNDDSVVVKVTYGDSEFLFTGDASSEVEEYLIETGVDLSCDVLKVSHHGSRTATTQEFVQEADPEYAILCIGDNIYNLPNYEVIKRLEDYGTEVYRTDDYGTIVVTSDGKEITVTTEK